MHDVDQPRDALFWAKPMPKIHVSAESGFQGPNTIEGRQLVSPLNGFGCMWQKTYRVRLHGVSITPAEVISTWKARFAEFWPRGNAFYAPLAGIRPGEVAMLSISAPGSPLRLSTGIRVIYADDESFTFMCPEGHMLAGWITFSAYRDEDGVTVVQAQSLDRTNDFIYEIGATLGIHILNERFWQATLRNLAASLGVRNAVVQKRSVCVDRRLQWANARNVRHNALLRSGMYSLASALRWLRSRFWGVG
jgi:hypothetical protein